MDVSKGQWIVAILALTMCLNFVAYAEPVYIYGGDFNLRIPADPQNTKGWMDDAIIDIHDHFLIYDLDVSINVTHSHVFDLQLYLKSPTGTRLCLNMYDLNEFFDGENYTQTIFDDKAQLSIEQAQPPFTGRFRPEPGTLLSVLDGQDTYGSWRLQIYDAYYADTGTLDRVELIITIPEPATATFLILGTGFVLCSLRIRTSRR
jgi:subtilisin-like proprotein convertase family protein